jgi:hypothetical protein
MIDRQATGQAGEFLVASRLARLGYSVALPSGNARDYDLFAYKGGTTRVVQVKCVSKGDLQLNLGRFLEIEMDDDRQVITFLKQCPDPNIDFVAVFLRKPSESDTLICRKLGDFQEFAVGRHKNTLAQFSGKRSIKPRKPDSLHASFTLEVLIEDGKFQNFEDYFS